MTIACFQQESEKTFINELADRGGPIQTLSIRITAEELPLAKSPIDVMATTEPSDPPQSLGVAVTSDELPVAKADEQAQPQASHAPPVAAATPERSDPLAAVAEAAANAASRFSAA